MRAPGRERPVGDEGMARGEEVIHGGPDHASIPAFRSVAETASRHRERAPGRAAVTVLLVISFMSCAILAFISMRGTWVETPFLAGSWAVEMGRDTTPGGVAVQEQVQAMRRVAAATAGLVSILSLLSLAGLLRQRSRLRRPSDRVHWAVGASRRDFGARCVGEGWRTGAVAGAASLLAGAALPAVLVMTFPGVAEAPSSLFWTSLLLVAMGVGILHRSRGVGIRAAGGAQSGLGALLSLPGMVVAPAFATLVLVGLLRADGDAPSGPEDLSESDGVATAVLEGLSPALRGPALAGWVERIPGPVGMASTGTLRGAGRTASVMVDCGQCSVGGLPLPVRTVRAELHALAPDTFRHLGIDLLEGRDFRSDDAGTRVTAAIVSRSMAIRHFQDGWAVGRRVRLGEGDWIEVVGVVEDRWDLRDPDEFALYLPLLQARPDAVELFESRGQGGLDEALAVSPSEARLKELHPVPATFAPGRWFEMLLGTLGALALVVAAAGTWLGARAEMRGRVGELALRRAIGARPRQLWRYGIGFVLRHFGGAILVGAWLAVALAVELERTFGMPPVLDARVWVAAALPLFAAFLAGALPPFFLARRAAPATRLEGDL